MHQYMKMECIVPLCIGILLEYMTCLESLTAWDMAGEWVETKVAVVVVPEARSLQGHSEEGKT